MTVDVAQATTATGRPTGRSGRPLRIGIPIRALTPGGVRRFVLELIRELVRMDDGCEIHAFYNDRNDAVLASALAGCRTTYVPGTNRVVWDYVSFPIAARREGLDYILYPNNIIPLSHLLLKTRRLNVVHDLAYFRSDLREYKYFESIYHRLLMGISCSIATHTVADSESTRKDLLSTLQVVDGKTSVVHLGIHASQFRERANDAEVVLSRLGMKRPYLFYCGSLSPRKNMLRVMTALKSIESVIPHVLYVSGGVSWNDRKVREYWARELPARVVHLGYLSEDELHVAYANATAFLYPSLHEGFGLPILEAQASGCPVITSTLTSCPEVAGSGACYVDAESAESIRDAILRIIDDPDYRRYLVEQGYENVARFSWARCASQYLAIMRNAELPSRAAKQVE